ncbi:hypothetical protein ACQPXM_16420 [Kribbella sp. CA-253562]|uniref:hypothetical protein n=1 Tax=Kribbella sp. CA-253562 TaxID=3239942 RepID=UPI003D8E09F9
MPAGVHHVLGDRELPGRPRAGWRAGHELAAAQLDGPSVDWDPFVRSEELAREY